MWGLMVTALEGLTTASTAVFTANTAESGERAKFCDKMFFWNEFPILL